ncbi:hypothetical protein [Cellulomonas alba]|uniref:YggT family protein n=1 Tax=Cellulomonas alba TaxID=3053467 RepID=A0ABT7SKH4_9CELL|nr:hypothetical protein [Cellulomonas alba]MDM7856666.1 hypothetical protein [Cellulomonas alba]
MITSAICNWFLHTLAAMLAWIPALDQSTQNFLNSVPGQVTTVMSHVGYFSPLVPFDQLSMALGVILVFWVISLGVQGTRIVLSFITVGGGGV